MLPYPINPDFQQRNRSLYLNEIQVLNSLSTDNGGAIYLVGAQVHISNSVIQNAESRGHGSAIFMNSAHPASFWNNRKFFSQLDMHNVTVQHCYTNGLMSNGTVHVTGDVEITNCNFVNNTAFAGGGVHIQGRSDMSSSAQFLDVVFSNNKALNSGGGISIAHQNVKMENCWFMNNTATELGGGLALTPVSYVDHAQGIAFNNIVVTGNQASMGGGLLLMTSLVPVSLNSCILLLYLVSIFI